MMLRRLRVKDEMISVQVGQLNPHRFVWEIMVSAVGTSEARTMWGGVFPTRAGAIVEGLAQHDAMCKAKLGALQVQQAL
ncbi:hypothetical protein [Schauerella aestuarii]|uniref:hypothetical protein n=1 Tax=Schauerella aestuarii TaxID=2511204 RepID=UPI00136E2032|nr:hypothetical protein [Achromobacter aestuarii]MYZ41902.1 hypothetical protein [Achromobacter aestuarii]